MGDLRWNCCFIYSENFDLHKISTYFWSLITHFARLLINYLAISLLSCMKIQICLVKAGRHYDIGLIMWIMVILVWFASYPSNGAKILGVLMTESKSRYSGIRNVANELASRRHEVCDMH